MVAHILVAYATRNGSTAEIAYAVGKELQETGAVISVADVRTISSLDGITGVVIGAPLYMGRLPAEVPKFTGQYCEQLSKMPVAAFAVGFSPLSKEAGAVTQAMDILKNTLAPLQPVSSALFAGKLDPAKINFLLKKFMEVAKIPSGDHRDWAAIASWAKGLPEKLAIER